jgi:hypothetical protein
MSAVNCSNPLDLILDMVDTCLATLAGLLAGPGLDLAPALCETVQVGPGLLPWSAALCPAT